MAMRGGTQLSLFEAEHKEPLREAIDFYKHPHGWSNRMVAGDRLLVMNSLLGQGRFCVARSPPIIM